MVEPTSLSTPSLEGYLRGQREGGLLLMTHIVLGYPSFDVARQLVDTMVNSGVDLMELQVPFSEPIADGPVIMHANQAALAAGVTVDRCLAFAAEVAAAYPIPFLLMSYYNPVFRRGVAPFAKRMQDAGLRGAIVPDLPPEEAGEYLEAMKANGLDPIFIYAPSTTDARMKTIAASARGFIYCVARRGVTGSRTSFSEDVAQYLARCRAATTLPIAVGFGVKDREDLEFLRDKCEIAVVGSETLRVLERDGIGAVGGFLKGLRAR